MLDNKTTVLISIVVVTLIAVLFLDPVSQDPAYHQFADGRTLQGIPNFWNVISNVPILIIGGLGIRLALKENLPGGLPEFRSAYLIFFIGVLLAALGSSWYHNQPDNQTLVWDRLPLSLSFMAFFAAIIGEFINIKAGKILLWPLQTMGILSVLYWHSSESSGAGDLRLYGVVQFLPMLLVPIILLIYPSRFNSNRMLWLMIVAYAGSKLAEVFDREIYAMLTELSGHTLKHFIAAIAAWFYYLALRTRRPVF